MLNSMTATHRLGEQVRSAHHVSDLQVRRAAAQLRKQCPENSWLEAAHRADRAYAAGQMFHFRLWGRVTRILRGRGANRLAAN